MAAFNAVHCYGQFDDTLIDYKWFRRPNLGLRSRPEPYGTADPVALRFVFAMAIWNLSSLQGVWHPCARIILLEWLSVPCVSVEQTAERRK